MLRQKQVCVSLDAHLKFVSVQNLDIEDDDVCEYPNIPRNCIQCWISTLLLGATKLTSLAMRFDGLPWNPVLGLLALRQLELTTNWPQPGLEDMLADLTFCTCLEMLKITEERGWGSVSATLPALCLAGMATLKSMELVGWCPAREFTLPPGCVLRLAAALEERKSWEYIQAKPLTISMLCLKCMRLQAWPVGIQEPSDLQFLSLHCKRMTDQDLAGLRHIPHVCLTFKKYSILLLTEGSWQSLEIHGEAGFSIEFSDAEEFVKGTERFLFNSTSQEAGAMYGDLREACMWQGVACHERNHVERNHGRMKSMTQFSNMDLWTATKNDIALRDVCRNRNHEGLISMDAFWPSRAAYPELYR